MSNPADNGGQSVSDALKALEGAVGDALERLSAMTRRAQAAETKSTELDELVSRVTGNPEEAEDLLARLKRLEEENVDLRGRVERGREGVDRLLAKVRFLEEQR